MLTLPLSIWLLSAQNYSFFLSRMTKGKSLRSGHLLITRKLVSSSSSSPSSLSPEPPSSSSSSEAYGDGEGDRDTVKPPMWAYCYAIWLTRVFTWYNSVVSVSRRASMRSSCTMMAYSITPLAEEKEGAEWAGGVVISVCGCFSRSWASLGWINAVLMAAMTVKCEDSG